MNFEQQWLEYDFNPFILFNSNGKVISLNAEAQFLLGTTTAKEIFELATTYANITFGFKTTFIELEYGRYKFFGITIGYENENEIGVKLYQAPSFKLNTKKPDGELTNIFTLVDLCISTNSINSTIIYKKEFDPTIPDIIIDSNNFIKILNKIYESYKDNNTILTKIYYRIGEHIKFEEKKYSLFSVEISAENIDKKIINDLKILAENIHFYIEIKKTITINIPMIKDKND